jgi:hypothetical protein
MHELQFTSELDEQNRIPVPADLALRVPHHATISVRLKFESPAHREKSNGALKYYMEHPIAMPGILPFNRDNLYSGEK